MWSWGFGILQLSLWWFSGQSKELSIENHKKGLEWKLKSRPGTKLKEKKKVEMHNFLAVPHAAGMWYHTPAARGTERENVEFLLQNPFLATKPDPTRPNGAFLGQNHLGNDTNSFHTSIFIHFLSFPPLFSHLSTPSPSPSSIFLHLPLFCTFLPSFIHGYSSLVGAWWSLLHQHG